MKVFLKNKVVEPLKNLLQQGLSVEKLAMSLTAGIVICCFPVIGLTTILCVIAASIFRLNHVAIQISNYFAYPLQIALILPFMYAGNKIFGLPPREFSLTEMTDHFRIDWMGFIQEYGLVVLRGCVAWLIFVPIATIALYYPMLWFIKWCLILRQKNSANRG